MDDRFGCAVVGVEGAVGAVGAIGVVGALVSSSTAIGALKVSLALLKTSKRVSAKIQRGKCSERRLSLLTSSSSSAPLSSLLQT